MTGLSARQTVSENTAITRRCLQGRCLRVCEANFLGGRSGRIESHFVEYGFKRGQLSDCFRTDQYRGCLDMDETNPRPANRSRKPACIRMIPLLVTRPETARKTTFNCSSAIAFHGAGDVYHKPQAIYVRRMVWARTRRVSGSCVPRSRQNNGRSSRCKRRPQASGRTRARCQG